MAAVRSRQAGQSRATSDRGAWAWVARALLSLVVATLVGALGSAGYRAFRDRQLRNRVESAYVEASCTIVSADVSASSHSGRAHGRDRHRDAHPVYGPEVRYSYRVNGQAFESSRYSLTPSVEHDRAVTEQLLERYRPGTNQPCWYDPEAPAESVLARE